MSTAKKLLFAILISILSIIGVIFGYLHQFQTNTYGLRITGNDIDVQNKAEGFSISVDDDLNATIELSEATGIYAVDIDFENPSDLENTWSVNLNKPTGERKLSLFSRSGSICHYENEKTREKISSVNFHLYGSGNQPLIIRSVTINDPVSIVIFILENHSFTILASAIVVFSVAIGCFFRKWFKDNYRKVICFISLLWALTWTADFLMDCKRHPETVYEEKDLGTMRSESEYLSYTENGFLSHGEITSLTIYPEKPIKVMTTTVYYDYQGGQNRNAKIHLITSFRNWVTRNYQLKNGRNSYLNWTELTEDDYVGGIKLDQVFTSGETFRIPKIIFNERSAVAASNLINFIPLAALWVFIIIFRNILILSDKRIGSSEKFLQTKRIMNVLLIVSGCTYLFLFYAPMDLYIHNFNEFWFDIYQIFPMILKIYLLTTFLLMGLVILLNRWLPGFGRIAAIIGTALFLFSVIQGRFLVYHLPAFNGELINWAEYSADVKISYLTMAFVLAVVFLLSIKIKDDFENLFSGLITITCAGLTLITAISAFQNPVFERKHSSIVTDYHEFEMSEEKNLVVLVLDSIRSTTFSQIINENPEYKEILSDFTYYPDTLGAYPFTQLSIPYIVSGEWHKTGMNYQDYLEYAYQKSPLLLDLENEGFDLGIYVSEFFPHDFKSTDRYENLFPGETYIRYKEDFLRNYYSLSLFRYVPFSLKPVFFTDKDVFFENRIIVSGGNLSNEYEQFSNKNSDFAAVLQKKKITLSPDKKFKLIHLDGAHTPYMYDEDLNIIPMNKGSYEKSIKASLKALSLYIQELKKAQVYDNTIIVVMADHGNGEIYLSLLPRMNPLFMVKGIHEKHDELIIDPVQVSYEDLQSAYTKLLSGEKGSKLFSEYDGISRQRKCYIHPLNWYGNADEYIVNGNAADPESFTASDDKSSQ